MAVRRINRGRWALIAALVLLLGLGGQVLWGWYGPGPLAKDTTFIVADGASMASVSISRRRASSPRLRDFAPACGCSARAGG